MAVLVVVVVGGSGRSGWAILYGKMREKFSLSQILNLLRTRGKCAFVSRLGIFPIQIFFRKWATCTGGACAVFWTQVGSVGI